MTCLSAYNEDKFFDLYFNWRFTNAIEPSDLMSIYWFFDAQTVLNRSLVADIMRGTTTKQDARLRIVQWLAQNKPSRRRRTLPY